MLFRKLTKNTVKLFAAAIALCDDLLDLLPDQHLYLCRDFSAMDFTDSRRFILKKSVEIRAIRGKKTFARG
ncbi:MAG: hypothetical protein ABI986_06570 [Chloroflexota bacterium]